MIRLGLAAPVFALVLSGCDSAHGNDTRPSPSPWIATAVGRIDTAEESRQLVAAVDGVIDHVLVARGDTVVRGQPLLRVDCDPRAADVVTREADAARAAASAKTLDDGARAEEIAVAQADADAARSIARNQQQRLDQATSLIDRGFVSKREVEARTNDRDAADAARLAAEARLTQLRNGARRSERTERHAAAAVTRGELGTARAVAEQCTLKSPVNGQVLQVLRREGEFSGASAGTPLIIVGDVSRLIVRAEINERDAAAVRSGQRAEIWVEGQPKRWSGRITHLASVMGRRSARSLDPTDRFDRDVREAFVVFDSGAPMPLVGLRVTVGVKQ
jgi:HlyD family secretion protein